MKLLTHLVNTPLPLPREVLDFFDHPLLFVEKLKVIMFLRKLHFLMLILLLMSCNGELLEELNDEQTAGNFCPTTRLASGQCPQGSPTSSWLFNNSANYTFDSNYVEISSGRANLKTLDQLFAGTDFNSGTHVGTFLASNGTLSMNSDGRSDLSLTSILPDRVSSMVGYWRFNGDLSDSSMNSNMGTPSGDASLVSGSRGGAMYFDGTGDFLNMGTSGVFDIQNELSIVTWVKPNLATGFATLIRQGGGTDEQYSIMIHEIGGAGKMSFEIYSTDAVNFVRYTSTGQVFYPDQWVHVVVTRAANRDLRFYMNGTLIDTFPATDNVPANGGSLYIGGLGFSQNSFTEIDEIAVYNAELTAAEVSQVFQTQNQQLSLDTGLAESWTPHWDNIVGYWKMDGNWQDSSGNGNHATTIVGNPSFSSNSRVGASAGEFDGTGDGARIPFDTSLNLDSAVSISAWLYFNSSSDTNGGIYEKTTHNNTNTQMLLFIEGEDVRFRLRNSSGLNTISTPESIPRDQWVHYMATWDGTDTRIYMNGTLVSSGTVTGPLNSGGGDSQIGRLFTGGTYETNGLLDDIAVWNIGLNATEVLQIYNRQKQKYAGHYDSPILDLGTSGSWTNLDAVTSLPFGKEIVAGVSESSSDYSSLSSNLNNGLEAYYKLNNNVLDSSGNGHDGTNNGALSFVANGFLGTHSGNFDAANDSISIPNTVLGNQNTTGMTLSAWIKPNSLNTRQGIVGFSQGAGYYYTSGGGIRLHSSGYPIMAGYNGSSYVDATSSKSVTVGDWHHIAGLFDPSSGDNIIYLNGEEVGRSNIGSIFNSNNLNYIGRNTGSAGSNEFWFDGLIDEVAIWSRALTATEIQQLYRRGANRVKYQVKSCVDAACNCKSYSTTPAGSSTDCDGDGTLNAADNDDIHAAEFIGPGGNGATSYSELFNRAAGDLTFSCTTNTTDSDNNICVDDEITLAGDARATSPSFTFSDMATSASPSNNRYFQYRVMMEAEDNSACSSAACLPELTSVEIGPTGRYYAGSPVVASRNPITYSDLSNMTFSEAGSCSLTYQLSPDGSTYYYHNGSAWVSAGSESVALSSNAATTAANIESFATTAGAGSLHFKAFMTSDTSQSCSLSEIRVIKSSGN